MANFRDLFGDPTDPRRVESALNKMFAAIEEAGGAVGSHAIAMPQVVAPERGPPIHTHPFEIISRGNEQKVLEGYVAWDEGTHDSGDGIIQRDVVCDETDFETVTGEKAWWLKMTYTTGQQSYSTVPSGSAGEAHILTLYRVASISFVDITLQDRDAYDPGEDITARFNAGTWYKKLADVDVASGNAFVETRYVQENLNFPELVDGQLSQTGH